jgi:tetratricopeptide (TPR) repeat protein
MQDEEQQISPKRKALIIAVSEYTYLSQLSFCKEDGLQMYKTLKRNGYQIPKNRKLIQGQLTFRKLHGEIIKFFTEAVAEDTLVFYYSGHGVPDSDFNIYLASSQTNPVKPIGTGFQFGQLTDAMNQSDSTRIVTILDCCHGGELKLHKGDEIASVRMAASIVKRRSKKLTPAEGKCLLSSSLGSQKSYELTEKNLSIFTYYLLEGLQRALENDGSITVSSLAKYVYGKFMQLSAEERQGQKPIAKTEGGGDITIIDPPPNGIKAGDTELKLFSTIRPIPSTLTADDKYSEYIDDANSYYDNEDYANSRESWDKAIIVQPKNYYPYYRKADCLFKLKEYNKAINCYELALGTKGGDKVLRTKALKNKGVALYFRKHYNKAKICFDEILQIEEHNHDFLFYKGLALSGLKKYDEAIQCFDEVLRLSPGHEEALRNKIQAQVNLQNQKSIKLYRQGNAFIDKENFDKGIESFVNALEINPSNDDARRKRDTLISIYPNSKAWYQKGNELIATDSPKAFECYQEALKKDPHFEDARKRRDTLLLQSSNPLYEYFNVKPDDAPSWYKKGNEFLGTNDFPIARRCFQEALQKDPYFEDARTQLRTIGGRG